MPHSSGLTPEDVILVVLVGFSSDFYQTRESLSHHKLVHQVLVILKRGQRERAMTDGARDCIVSLVISFKIIKMNLIDVVQCSTR